MKATERIAAVSSAIANVLNSEGVDISVAPKCAVAAITAYEADQPGEEALEEYLEDEQSWLQSCAERLRRS